MANDPGSSLRFARRGLSLSDKARIDARVIEDAPSRNRTGRRRGLSLGDWADVTPLVVDNASPPRNPAETTPRSLRPDALQLTLGVGVAGIVSAQAVSAAINVPTAGSGAVLVVLQTSGPVFVALVTISLLLACRQLRGRPAARFWINCVGVAALTYVAWSAIYFIADGGWRHPLPAALTAFAHDLLVGSARLPLGLVFVAVQLCVVLPVVRWLIRVTRGMHPRLLMVSFVLQLAVSAGFYWALPVSDPARLLPSYLLFVVAGAVFVDHQEESCHWIGRHLGVAVAFLAAGTLVAELSYGVSAGMHVPPGRAAQAVQPAVTIAAMAALIALVAAGARWEGRRRPWWQLRLLSRWSEALFGAYLVSPLLVQVGLALFHAGGLGAPSSGPAGAATIVLGLGCGVPLLLAMSWLLATGLRRGPLSVALIARRRPPRARPTKPGPMAMNATPGLAGLALLLAVAVAAPPWPPARTQPGDSLAPSSPYATTTVAPVAPATNATMQRITAQGRQRRYEVIQPQHPVSTKLPVLVFLQNTNVTLTTEEHRDGLLPLVTAGQAILVYPAGVDQSWNDGACCSFANRHGVDDVAFLTDVVHASAKIHDADPNLVDVVGYGGGGRMAYHLVCQRPRLAAGAVAIAALPVTACPSGPPVPLLQVASNHDPLSPYQRAVKQVSRWVKRDGCRASPSADVYGDLTLQRWSACSHGSRVEFATYAGARHDPFGGGGTPTLARVMVSFVEQTAFTG